MNKLTTSLRADGSGTKLVTLSGSLAMVAASGDPKQLRKFAMEAYNGGPMLFDWSQYPVVVDLAGMQITDKSRPILKDHQTSQEIGRAHV